MAAYFFDSSALVKRYVAENGSAWVGHITIPSSGNRIYVSRLASVEAISAIARRAKGGSISPQDAISIIAEIHGHFRAEYRIIEPSPGVVADANHLAEVHALRGYDAVQLAAAMAIHKVRTARGAPALSLVSADSELNVAAAHVGLSVIDPNAISFTR